ncbi:MAG: DUF975 family protein [Lachnospiraceae bacterium]|nr:DUF975 family protein [Lachnospiraceae bacterium]
MWTRAELKSNAKIVLQQNYWKSVLVAFLIFIIGGGPSGSNGSSYGSANSQVISNSYGYIGFFNYLGLILTIMIFTVILILVISLFLLKPLEVGCRRYFISARSAPGDLSLLGLGFKNSYMNIVKTQFLRSLFIFLWSLLFLIPGIIKFYEYRMMTYILAENPGLDSNEVFARSKAMMTGDKWNAFVLDLSFIGWHILGALTCFALTVFYTFPYQQSTNAELYEALRGKI